VHLSRTSSSLVACEEGAAARRQLDAVEGDAPALLQLMDAFPDWADPVNRLATHRFMEGLEAIRDGAGDARPEDVPHF
jgi:hypothetical protein